MRLDTARRYALSLPESSEAPHFEKSSFRVRGKIFATVPPDGTSLNVRVGESEAHALRRQDPATFEPAMFGATKIVTDWIHVNLATADAGQVRELVKEAWRRTAPKRLVSRGF